MSGSNENLTSKYSSRSVEEVYEDLNVSRRSGLSAAEVEKRKKKYGLNKLRETKQASAIDILINQFKSLIVLLLVAAAVISLIFGDLFESIAIMIVLAVNTGIGFFTEIRAVRSMEALRKMGKVATRVRRDGEVKEIPADEIVPGDVVLLSGGDIVTADIRIVEASKLQCDESALTGESVPVSKNPEVIEEEVSIAERKNMVFKGTAVTRGEGEGIVVGTGMNTELGEISTLVGEAEDEKTPLEKKLASLGNKLILVTLGVAAVATISGILSGREVFLMVETGIALAVAAIPEGLPIVATVALARGMWRMAKRNALINQLSSVETLGGTGIIFTDKTGTLTENKMTVTKYAFESGDIDLAGEGESLDSKFSVDEKPIRVEENRVLKEALEVGVLCNNASLPRSEDQDDSFGDPLEISLLVAGRKGGIKRKELLENQPEVREVAFDPEVKMMATYHKKNRGYRVAVKGAPEVVLKASTHIMTESGKTELNETNREKWLERNKEMAKKGLRLLALASKTVESREEEPYQNLTFIGLVAMLDPARADIKESIERAQQAGIRVIMVTGDQADTAKNIGISVGLAKEEDEVIHADNIRSFHELSEEEKEIFLRSPIFARVSPKQKLDILTAHQETGSVVAMTGDGVNDAPALKKADIGISMGKRGTQVAQEASDMVLKDDAFSTILSAIEEGRIIFNNIKKFVFYLLSCNISEIMVIALGSVLGLPLPLLPLQILFLNMVNDVFPALSLGMGEGNPNIMNEGPRDPKEPVLTKNNWWGILGYGAIITASVIISLVVALTVLGLTGTRAITISFLTLALAQLWHVFNMRGRNTSVLSNEVTRNKYVLGSLVLCVGLIFLALYVPGVSDVLDLVPPGLDGWALVIGLSLVPFIIGQLFLSFPDSKR